ncbi:SpaH/EbpB family LPXTG-anchored major pilin [Gardnerella sp. DNF00354]|uniref:SpaH/EbpB family LPXTG-anchored major pilin n=1 Tax=Gardnerella sp. DNF00354 TaxID=2749046 RepID=UPI003BB19F1B
MNKITKQCVAAVASLAMAGTLCVAGAVVAGSSAWADTTPSVDKTVAKGTTGLNTDSQAGDYKSAPWMTDAPKSGSITIYKWKSETDGDGNQKKETPVKDAEFTIKKVKSVNSKDLDLTKYDSWVDVAKAAADLNTNKTGVVVTDDAFGTNGKLSGNTNDSGVLRFKDLPLGLYQVQETKAPEGYSAAETRPFYMTLPMIQQITTGSNKETKYNYAPFVDPKNVNIADSVKKTKDTTKTVGAGDEISYTITADLDKVKAKATDSDRVADEFKGYSVFDLAPDKYFESYDNVVKKVKAGSADLTPNTDYTVGTPTDVAGGKKKIEITFTDEGRKKLAAAANASVGKAAKVTVELTFKLAATTTLATNSVTNEGGIVPSHDTGTTPSEVKTKDNPKVDFATFKIKKVSSKDNSPLKDAKFRLFASKDAAQKCTDTIKSGKTSASTGDDKTAYDAACVTPSSTGFAEKTTAEATGLTEAYSVKRGEEFYAVETVAPAGYIRNPNVHPIKVDENKAEETITVENLPDSGNDGKSWLFNLPKTGAAGVIIFALIGLGLVGSGMFVFLKNRKKEEEQAA